jgi:GNAT superfamily N-acetyltransferase
MSNPPVVRAARPDDYPEIMQMCADLHEENGAVDVDWPTVEATIMRGINNDMAMIGVIGKTGSIEAMGYIKFSSMWYSKTPMLEELFMYVKPEYRRTPNAKTLLRWVKDTRKKLGVRLIIGVISTIKTQAKLALYERELGKPVGGFFFME